MLPESHNQEPTAINNLKIVSMNLSKSANIVTHGLSKIDYMHWESEQGGSKELILLPSERLGMFVFVLNESLNFSQPIFNCSI